jgi:hypothetical protein
MSAKYHNYLRFLQILLPVPQYGYPLSPCFSLFSLLALPPEQFSSAHIDWIISDSQLTLSPSSNSLFLKPFVPSIRSFAQTGLAFSHGGSASMNLLIEAVAKHYRGNVWGLQNISLALCPGVLGLLGPNGAGNPR